MARQFTRGRRVLEYLDQHPRLLAFVERVRTLLPGDPGYGDPLSVSGSRTSNVLGQQLANLANRKPSALREFGLGALQVWQAYASSQPNAVGTADVSLVFTDLGKFSDWTLKVGDDAALALLREVSAEVEPMIGIHGGRLVKRLGDGLMAVFAEPGGALEFMIGARDAVDALASNGSRPRMRCGAHLGKPSKLGGDYFGADVNIAARVAAAAAPGEVLVSSSMYEQLDLDRHELRKRLWFRAKGVPAEVRVYTVMADD
ncbi:adenylate/guanylate cyclase domain-containing protein [Sciscionella marina]|uniref:adenylate/guanylate cyclase domain-containing protein n=1 Tax=Sciscionella marina TaxID=508770 RepID=UPI001F09B6F2|nr:adenylate/guanylate cyclase domain-containing protein [Sciscionella marina]